MGTTHCLRPKSVWMVFVKRPPAPSEAGARMTPAMAMSSGRVLFFGSSLAMGKRIFPVHTKPVEPVTVLLRGLALMPWASRSSAMPAAEVVPPTR